MSRPRLDASSGKPGSGPDGRIHGDCAGGSSAAQLSDPNGNSAMKPVLDNDVEHELSRLETQMTDVLEAYRRLQIENRSLRAHQIRMIEERARLVEKNETARTKVEQMIMRLKSLEAGQQ